MQFDDLIAPYPETVASLAIQTQSFVLAHCPGITEEIDIPAHMSAYNYGEGYKNVICTIILSRKGVKLGFYKGSELPDREGLLEGKGKVHKYVTITSTDILRNKALVILLKAALAAYQERIAESL